MKTSLLKRKPDWIWAQTSQPISYNQTIIASKSISLDSVRRAFIDITADSYYRLYINGKWIGDGPPKCWPEHYLYDRYDISRYLHKCPNIIKILARFYGTGTFHRIPQMPGLMALLEIQTADKKLFIKTD